jgi:uncharacterized protein YutD
MKTNKQTKEEEILDEIKFIDKHPLMDYDTKIRLSNNAKAELKGYKQGRKDAIEKIELTFNKLIEKYGDYGINSFMIKDVLKDKIAKEMKKQ